MKAVTTERCIKIIKSYNFTVVQKLHQVGSIARLEFCDTVVMVKSIHCWHVDIVCSGEVNITLLSSQTKAWFYLSRHINTQNNRYLSLENHRLMHELLLHNIKVGVWCAIGAMRTTRIFLFFRDSKFKKIY